MHALGTCFGKTPIKATMPTSMPHYSYLVRGKTLFTKDYLKP